MAYEVTKQIGGRAYLYRVESVRDPETGRRRNRWTYVGRADRSGAAAPARHRGPDGARGRLLDALERLLAERDFGDVTAGAIASAAGLAHGTFYRHFADKRAALRAALDRSRDRRGPLTAALRADVATEARGARGAARDGRSDPPRAGGESGPVTDVVPARAARPGGKPRAAPAPRRGGRPDRRAPARARGSRPRARHRSGGDGIGRARAARRVLSRGGRRRDAARRPPYRRRPRRHRAGGLRHRGRSELVAPVGATR